MSRQVMIWLDYQKQTTRSYYFQEIIELALVRVCGQVYFVILRIFSIKLEEFNKLMIQIWYLKIFVTLFSLSFSSISLHVSGSILCYMKRFAEDYVIDSCKIGSMSVSEQLRTYPSPNPATVDWWQVRVNVGLGEGLVRNCSDTDFDL